MSRGIVMSVQGASSVVLTPDGQFVRLRKQADHTLGREVEWSEEAVLTGETGNSAYSNSAARRRRRGLLSFVSAAAVLMLAFGLWQLQPPTVVAYVTMDVNPSLELALDKDENVRKLVAVNDDAVPVIAGVSYRGKPVAEVAKVLAARLTSSPVLAGQDGEIVIASVAVRKLPEDWEAEVKAAIENAMTEAASRAETAVKPTSLHVTKLTLPVEVRERAQQAGVSSGKMAFLLKAESEGHDVSIETLKSTSMKKIAAPWGGVEQVLGDSDQAGKDSGKSVGKGSSNNNSDAEKAEKEAWKALAKKYKEKAKNEKTPKPVSSAGSKQDQTRDDAKDKGKKAQDGYGQKVEPKASDPSRGSDKNDKNDKDGKDGKRDDTRKSTDDRGKSERGKSADDDAHDNRFESEKKVDRRDDRNSGEDRGVSNNGKKSSEETGDKAEDDENYRYDRPERKQNGNDNADNPDNPDHTGNEGKKGRPDKETRRDD